MNTSSLTAYTNYFSMFLFFFNLNFLLALIFFLFFSMQTSPVSLESAYLLVAVILTEAPPII